MAYNDSGELPVSQSTYSLGGYTFELKVQTVHEPGEEDVVSVYAICRGPDGTRETQAVDYPVGTTIENWRVECNENEATVYATKKYSVPPLSTGNLAQPFAVSGGSFIVNSTSGWVYTGNGNVQIVWYSDRSEEELKARSGWLGVLIVSDNPDASLTVIARDWQGRETSNTYTMNDRFTYQGKTAYFHNHGYAQYATFIYPYEGSTWSGLTVNKTTDGNQRISPPNPAAYHAAWIAVYGNGGEEEDPTEVIVARFAIDIREADTDSWDEPGSDGPPGTTLNVTVTGATAGSCTGTPSDNLTVKGYGDGGDGGYGGGGGAGASTVIIYEFATDIAESVQQEAISRGPGTGGPGGKGGKGGDGCILIFY